MARDDRYTYTISWSEDDREYVGLCAELPALSWLARTPEAALKGICKVVEEVVADMAKNGETVPEPFLRGEPEPVGECETEPVK